MKPRAFTLDDGTSLPKSTSLISRDINPLVNFISIQL